MATAAAALLFPATTKAEEVAWGAEQFAPDLVWQPREQVARKAVSGAAQYPTRFITYLSRFLLNFDEASAQWWAWMFLPTFSAMQHPRLSTRPLEEQRWQRPTTARHHF